MDLQAILKDISAKHLETWDNPYIGSTKKVVPKLGGSLGQSFGGVSPAQAKSATPAPSGPSGLLGKPVTAGSSGQNASLGATWGGGTLRVVPSGQSVTAPAPPAVGLVPPRKTLGDAWTSATVTPAGYVRLSNLARVDTQTYKENKFSDEVPVRSDMTSFALCHGGSKARDVHALRKAALASGGMSTKDVGETIEHGSRMVHLVQVKQLEIAAQCFPDAMAIELHVCSVSFFYMFAGCADMKPFEGITNGALWEMAKDHMYTCFE
jgi:hypothetical protein